MVLVNGFAKPVSCDRCPFLFYIDGGGNRICKAEMGDCPLVEVEDTQEKFKCSSNVVIKPDGETELDPCVYELVDRRENCIVEVFQCQNCGHIEVTWIDKDKHPELVEEEF